MLRLNENKASSLGFHSSCKTKICLASKQKFTQSESSPSFQSEIHSSLQANTHLTFAHRLKRQPVQLSKAHSALKAKSVAQAHLIRLLCLVGLRVRAAVPSFFELFLLLQHTKTAVKLYAVVLGDICAQAKVYPQVKAAWLNVWHIISGFDFDGVVRIAKAQP